MPPPLNTAKYNLKYMLRRRDILKCPKQPPKVHLSFSKTRYDIEMKKAKYCEVSSKVPIFINKT